ncbi:MAG: twin-arginine translocase TatA/TatE family subunit [Candidatus Obscuribacterales bacterium]|nr:twin-arginine translocase TatA/TatE family subunit [Candidatus Obscuribacterales bacterium]
MLNSPVDIALLFGVALLIFGPKKLPEIGKALGQGIGNFKRSMTEAKDEVTHALKAEDSKNPPTGSPVEPETSTPAGTSDANR